MFKKLVCLTLTLFSSLSFAGAFSEIDNAVREAVVESMPELPHDEVWGLNIQEERNRDCLMVVEAFARNYRFEVCINEGRWGFEGEVIQQ